MQIVVESGMNFGPFGEDRCFLLEKSETYRKIANGVKIAEFLLLRENSASKTALWIVEAKSSSPHPRNETDFHNFLSSLSDKFTNSICLSFAAVLGRHPLARDELPRSFQSLNLKLLDVRFVLVIKENPVEWLPPLQEAIRIKLRPIVRTLALNPNAISVINQEKAAELQLMQVSS